MTHIFHGTSFENAQSILESGFHSQDKNMLWDVSDSDSTYFWNPKNMIKHGECDNMEDAINRCIQMAIESAQVSAALTKSRADSVIVLEYAIPDSKIEDDDSGNNMELACKVSDDIINNKKPVAMYAADFSVSFSGLYLIGLLNNEYMDLYSHLEPHEIKMLEALYSKEIYMPEEMMYPEWEETSIESVESARI